MPLSIIVLGAGIAGPVFAAAAAKSGHNVTLLERYTTTDRVGYAFRLTPNADRCLQYLGIDTVHGGAVEANANSVFAADGRLLFKHGENKAKPVLDQAKSVFTLRPALNGQLMDLARSNGVNVRLGTAVSSVDVENTAVQLETGEVLTADLIVAADGVKSIVRENIVDPAKYFPKMSSGHGSFRFMMPKRVLQNDPLLSPLVAGDSHMFNWVGNDKRVIAYPVDFDKTLNFNGTFPANLYTGADDTGTINAASYDIIPRGEQVQEIFREFEPRVQRLFELADPDGFRYWPMGDMDELPTWSKKQVVMIGDAAHPVLPFGFSGAAMAIEDATTLGILLDQRTTPDSVSEKLELFEGLRKPRVNHVRETSRVLATGGGDFKGYIRWLSEHDAVAAAQSLVE